MVSNGIRIQLQVYLCILVLYIFPSLTHQNDFRYISYQDLQTSITRFQSEENTSFTQILFDVSRNQMIVGATDGLYRLSLSRLRLLEYANWEPSEDTRRFCIEKGQSDGMCHNFINIILSNGKDIFACGTNAFSPQCSWRQIDYISNVTSIIDGVAQSPSNPEANITAILLENGEYYFGGPTDSFGSDTLISKSVDNTVILRTKQYNNFWLNEPQFVGSFESDKFVYFLFREVAVEYMNCGKNVYSRIARVCKNDNGGGHVFKDNWTTYIKARLNCSLSGDYPFYFNEIQGMTYMSNENIVYAIFSTSPNSIEGSAICAFNLTTINEVFDGPFKYQQDINSAWNKHTNVYKDHFNCITSQKNVNLLETFKYQLMDSAVQATTIDPLHVATGERFTHITLDVVGTKSPLIHVIYVATQRGVIKKLSLLPHFKKACIVEIWQAVPDANILIRNMQFLKETNSLYITTNTGVSQISVDHCKRHSTFENCINAMDPYCGWNEREDVCAIIPEDNPDIFWKQKISSCPLINTTVDGRWSSWSSWAPCFHKSSSESDSSNYCMCQIRHCNNPAPANNGEECKGPSVSVTNCTVHGEWSDWSAWSACSASCGAAVKTRTRTCTNPSPAFGGRVCVGADKMEAFCSEYLPCPSKPIDGGWGPWSPWTSCTVPCSGGYRLRQRKCDNPIPTNGGQYCKGNDIEYERCNEGSCEEIKTSYTTDWLTITSDNGYHKKRFKISCRATVKSSENIRIYVKEEEKYCSNSQCLNDNDGWGNWSEWSECSVDCGIGIQKRTRSCKKIKNCIGESSQTKECINHNCENAWSSWSEWSSCNVSCGWGFRIRNRTCLESRSCVGASIEQQSCEEQECEVSSSLSSTTLEHINSCTSVGFSFFFVGAIVGLFPYLACLIYNYLRRRKNTVPSSPHYITATQNPYIAVPRRERESKKHSFVLANPPIKAKAKFLSDDFEPPTTLKRSSHDEKIGFTKQFEDDNIYYD
ncbi:semaphorin-5A [Diorhabda carinulata]|uniref:semaphorin-5A n=1 Tax=Diorhabda carinulata TaxID=1163345 RepID=UPI0025A0E01C|nr:semaphorin-5A [Diorhabda carinulata]XP_057667567.1 semaphorin-5A [Diorhabda carinulata]XP_057667578.1 semaphorin-5A [Diorhabda carinulata]XP_057667587.1 semaphorin-5A [Diorhabda carinulata]XP_057667597.1 semaphorin-5A [Diorhabda carinulata]XP_057667604.1 semaphorin-5A [Diorhabda carinulata]